VKRITCPIGGASISGGEDRGSKRSEERTESARLSDAGSPVTLWIARGASCLGLRALLLVGSIE
jgi:hypothetical protein